ncbi:unnamed protein product [Prorocentrum cordatum]|uniref:Uncharacterized protein n=1 Tax=Prorocentrum cordatum TaxID=2364126 RepID=A0ABN9SWD3_9DINO|nr:unnamed protein product [Polarella glacialis]
MGSGAAARASGKPPWRCKSRSAPEAKGFRKLNFGDRSQRKWRNCPKSSHFGGKPTESAPSKSIENIKLAKALEKLEQLKAMAAGQKAPGTGQAACEKPPEDAQLKSIADQTRKIEKQNGKDRGELTKIKVQKDELEAKAEALRQATSERDLKLAEFKVLGGFEVDEALQRFINAHAIRYEQQRRDARAAEAEAAAAATRAQAAGAAEAGRVAAVPGESRGPVPGEGAPTGGDAMGDEELECDNQHDFLKKAGQAPAPPEGSERPDDDAARAVFKRYWDAIGATPPKRQREDGDAYYSEVYEAKEQASRELSVASPTGALRTRAGEAPQAQTTTPAAFRRRRGRQLGQALGGQSTQRGQAALARGKAGSAPLPQQRGGWAEGQTQGGLVGVFGHQGYGLRMSVSAGLEESSEGKPWASAPGHGPEGEAEGFSPSKSQPLPHMQKPFDTSQGGNEQEDVHLWSHHDQCDVLGVHRHAADGESTLAIGAQEHHRLARDLAAQQRASRDAVWHGVWSAAAPSPTSAAGSVGRVAALAPASAWATALPGRSFSEIVPGRPVAGRVRAGPRAGIVILSVYLHVGEGLSGSNIGIVWQLSKYLGQLETEGYHWDVLGDWNMEPQVLDFGWITQLRAAVKVAEWPPCRQGSGSRIDYFAV